MDVDGYSSIIGVGVHLSPYGRPHHLWPIVRSRHARLHIRLERGRPPLALDQRQHADALGQHAEDAHYLRDAAHETFVWQPTRGGANGGKHNRVQTWSMVTGQPAAGENKRGYTRRDQKKD